jgi:hypothetical protein
MALSKKANRVLNIDKTSVAMRKDGATALVRRTREIIQYFNPSRWVIENPVGLLRHQPIMDDLSHLRKTVSYCRYGFPYRKNTDLWTNIDFQPLRCAHGTYCDMRSKRGKHDQTVQQNGAKRQSMKTRYAIPSSLIYDLLTDPSMTQLFPKSNYSPKATSCNYSPKGPHRGGTSPSPSLFARGEDEPPPLSKPSRVVASARRCPSPRECTSAR